MREGAGRSEMEKAVAHGKGQLREKAGEEAERKSMRQTDIEKRRKGGECISWL